MLHTTIFIGRSGCGKGTQAALIKDYISQTDPDKRQILYVETGVHFRRFVQGESLASKLSNETYEKDERQPDFLACWMWSNILINELKEDMHLVFDGAPRSLPEAQLVTTAMEFFGREEPRVIHIDVSRKWSEERLHERGRSDDVAESRVAKRLNWFDEEVKPAIEYFRSNSLYRFIEVKGEQPIKKVHEDILAQYE